MKNYYWRFWFNCKESDGSVFSHSSCVVADTAKNAREKANSRIVDMGYVLENCRITGIVAYKEYK